MVQQYGPWAYAALFAIVFLETGIVVFPFLPGDSLIFAAAALAASMGSFDVLALFFVFVTAAIIGDTVNYWIGHATGPRIFKQEETKLFKKKYLDQAHAFYERHGGKTIFLARFIPVLRTFAPYVAGAGTMDYRRFIVWNVVGALAWVAAFLGAGYYFGNLGVVKDNFTLLIVAIILISFVPLVAAWLWERRKGASKI
jgi:membrane-associated protein